MLPPSIGFILVIFFILYFVYFKIRWFFFRKSSRTKRKKKRNVVFVLLCCCCFFLLWVIIFLYIEYVFVHWWPCNHNKYIECTFFVSFSPHLGIRVLRFSISIALSLSRSLALSIFHFRLCRFVFCRLLFCIWRRFCCVFCTCNRSAFNI